MSKVSFYSVNGSGGAYVSIPSTMFARRVEIIEDESVTPQGLTAEYPQDSYSQVYTYGATTEPLILGNVVAHGNNDGTAVGQPGLNIPAVYAGGTTYNTGDAVLDTSTPAVAWVCIKDGTVGISPTLGANWRLHPNYRPADIYVKLRSNTITATKVRVTEIE